MRKLVEIILILNSSPKSKNICMNQPPWWSNVGQKTVENTSFHMTHIHTNRPWCYEDSRANVSETQTYFFFLTESDWCWMCSHLKSTVLSTVPLWYHCLLMNVTVVYYSPGTFHMTAWCWPDIKFMKDRFTHPLTHEQITKEHRVCRCEREFDTDGKMFLNKMGPCAVGVGEVVSAVGTFTVSSFSPRESRCRLTTDVNKKQMYKQIYIQNWAIYWPHNQLGLLWYLILTTQLSWRK